MSEAEWIAFLQRPEIPAFNRAMLDNPDDDLPRLVFADWVEENHPHRRFAKLLRLSIHRPKHVVHFSAFPEMHGVQVGLWRGRFALEQLRVMGGGPNRLLRAELEVLPLLASSGWVGRVSAEVWGSDGEVTSPTFVTDIHWAGVEWLEIGGHIDRQPALSQFVFAHPQRFPKLSAVVNCGEMPDPAALRAMFASPLITQLTHFDLGFRWNWPEVEEVVRTSPHLTAQLKARWGWAATDDGGANR